MEYLCDHNRHLVCVPYSLENLHDMARDLEIARRWFHKDHYDIPKRRVDEIMEQCCVVRTRKIMEVIPARPPQRH